MYTTRLYNIVSSCSVIGAADGDFITQTAALLVGGCRDCAPNTWPDMEAALEEVHES